MAMHKGLRKQLAVGTPLRLLKEKYEQTKASMRAKVGYPFRVIKQQFGVNKLRYPGIAKTRQQAADNVGAGQSVVGLQEFEGGAGMGAPAGAPYWPKAVNAA
ncbi:hypothetical protein [Comamonas sp. MYb69]|uniref:hypothetical protein n=1 Tax=Comamonas sp. MYb69 TaxID=1848650 RepID=UPI0030A927B0